MKFSDTQPSIKHADDTTSQSWPGHECGKAQQNPHYPELKAIESHDVWFGDPRDMPNDIKAFFDLED